MKIGTYTLSNPVALAPMAGVTDLPFRQLCRDLGAGYVVSEMVSCDPRLRHTRKSQLRSNHQDEARPVSVQIAGSDPQWMAEAAQYNVSLGAQIIDINMGCPAKKVCNKAAGSALLAFPDQVKTILEATVQAVDVPVTLKIRTGPDPDSRNGVEIAQMAQQAGIQALAVHGRTRADKFNGQAEYKTIAEIVEAVDIPVFANGDIETPQQAKQVLEETAASGIMVGRAAQGNPWIFREINHYLKTGTVYPGPSETEFQHVMSHHLRQLHAFYGEHQGVRVARKHLGWYLKYQPQGESTRKALMRAESAEEQLTILFDYFARIQRQAA